MISKVISLKICAVIFFLVFSFTKNKDQDSWDWQLELSQNQEKQNITTLDGVVLQYNHIKKNRLSIYYSRNGRIGRCQVIKFNDFEKLLFRGIWFWCTALFWEDSYNCKLSKASRRKTYELYRLLERRG